MKKITEKNTDDDEIVSISSLESPEHAENIDPKILTISWMIGKRCNYDCSYCPSWLHDSFSPHMPVEYIKKTIDSMSSWTLSNDKKFKIAFTGGEPFIHPNFLDILNYINKKENVHSIIVVTNGSAKLSTYMEASKNLNNLTVSLHLEEPEKTIEDTIEKIIYLNNNTNMFINVNVMAVSNKVKTIPKIAEYFDRENIKFTINKIRFDDFDEVDNKKISRSQYKENKKYFDLKNSSNKIKYRSNLTNKKINDYYTSEELEIIEKTQQLMKWEDTRVYYKTHVEEKNSHSLLIGGQTNFFGWHCYIGVDCIYISYDGSIYRGVCCAGETIGNISDSDIKWPNDTIICPYNVCSCSADIRIRKAKNTDYLKNISNV